MAAGFSFLAVIVLPVAAAVTGFNTASGRFSGLPGIDGRPCLVDVETEYLMMSSDGDTCASEREDEVVEKSSGDGWTVFKCVNPKLPGIEIVKRYKTIAGGLERTLVFRSNVAATRYVSPTVACRFGKDFIEKAYHLGAGYIGPYKPFPKVGRPVVVEEYLQSSKGIAIVNDGSKLGGFCHYRSKIGDTVVFPWWHSTIGHYREKHDRLWYLPDGYRMCLGTFGIKQGAAVSATDKFVCFDGGLFGFFDGVFARDPDFSAELKSIPPPPEWIADVVVNTEDRNNAAAPWLLDMLDDGDVMLHAGPAIGLFSWGDYRFGKGGFGTCHGGKATDDEVRRFVAHYKGISPRIHFSNYGIVISAGAATPVAGEHPEWFRMKDRARNPDPLFPGVSDNWQTMFCHSDARRWISGMLCDFAEALGLDTIYLDETQMTNTIDWERECVTQDDDTVKFWKTFVTEKNRRGGKMFFANGSGIPYVDVNYIEECRGTLKPERWRDGAGVLLGQSMMNRLRRGQRTIPLYWYAGNDYANRVLALGWIPRAHLRFVEEVPVIRAVWQAGHLEPLDVRYTPDWKRDPATAVESYAMRREDAKDVVLSFINRARSPADVPVSIDLSTLGFTAGERISIYRQHLDFARAGADKSEILADREIKEAWRNQGTLRGARISDPELVYSGPANGIFRTAVASLAPDRMEQFFVSASPAVFFSENGMPQSVFMTRLRKARIVGRTAIVERSAEILLLDKDRDFTEVTANGQPVRTRTVAIGGMTGLLVSLGKGEWRLDWRETPRKAASAAADLPKPGGIAKTAFPQKMREWYPEIRRTEAVAMHGRGGAKMSAKFVYRSCMDSGNLLQADSGLDFSAVSADEKKATLAAGTTRREGEIEGMENFSGFEIADARRLSLRFSTDFIHAATASADSGHAAPWTLKYSPDKIFAGLIVDYRVGGRYIRRVVHSAGLGRETCTVAQPFWGTGSKPDAFRILGNWLDSGEPHEFTLDLAADAPDGWDGTAIVSLGTACIQAGRRMTLEFIDFKRGRDD